MRKLLVMGAVGILSGAAWSLSADDGSSSYKKMHPRPDQGGLQYHMRHGGGHFAIGGQLGMYFPTPPGIYSWESEPGPAPIMPRGGLVVGGTEHTTSSHPPGLAIHPHTHVQMQGEGGQGVSLHPTAPIAAASHPAGAATRQPNPARANPSTSRPPGDQGPGRPVSGWSSPGLPGPGQPPSSRW